MTKKIVYLLFCAALVFTGCMTTAGTSDETVIKSAKIYNPDLTVAPHVDINVFLVSDTTRIPIYQTSTDKNGQFSVKLDNGMYNIMIGNEQLAAFQDSVIFGADYSTLTNDTLATTAVLCGNITIQPEHNPRSVTVQIVGTNRFSNVAMDGTFSIVGLAKGEYQLRCVSTLPEYTPTYSPFDMNPPEDDTTFITVPMIYTGIPVVKNITLTYDTLLGNVTISWDTLSYFMFKEFVVYRDIDSTGASYSVATTTSCSFIDSKPLQADIINNVSSPTDREITYHVAVKTKTLSVGSVFETAKVHYKQPLNLHLKSDSAQWYVTVPNRLHAAVTGYRSEWPVKYEWDIGGTGTFVESSGPDTTISIPDTMLEKPWHCKVKVTVNNRLTLVDSVTATGTLSWVKTGSLNVDDIGEGLGTTLVWNDKLLYCNSMWDRNGSGPCSDIYQSSDGVSWELLASNTPITYNNSSPVVFQNNLCIVDRSGFLWTSKDGIAWAKGIVPVCSTFVTELQTPRPPGIFVYDNKLFIQPLPEIKQGTLLYTENLIDWKESQLTVKKPIMDYTEFDGKTYLYGVRLKRLQWDAVWGDSVWFGAIENGTISYHNSVGFTTEVGNPEWYKYHFEVFKGFHLLTENLAPKLMEVQRPNTFTPFALALPMQYSILHSICIFKDHLYCFSYGEVYRAQW